MISGFDYYRINLGCEVNKLIKFGRFFYLIIYYISKNWVLIFHIFTLLVPNGPFLYPHGVEKGCILWEQMG